MDQNHLEFIVRIACKLDLERVKQNMWILCYSSGCYAQN